MLYMELRGTGEVVTYLHHSPNSPDRWTTDEVLAGEQDAEISQLFGKDAVDEVKAAILAARGAGPPPTKQQLMEARRREGRKKS